MKRSITSQSLRGLATAGIVAGLSLAPALTPSADAAGLLIADGGLGGVLEIKDHDVKVVINNGIAVTKVTQVFHNTENRQVEALYTFPVPKGASVSNFSMWINGKEMVGEVLEKKRAREIYNSYKAVKRDPGLLEQVDYKTFEMRIFPIAAQADQKVEVTYYQELDLDHDWMGYTYPLATVTRPGLDSRTTGSFSLAVEVKSAVPITLVESPSHSTAVAIAQHREDYCRASLELPKGALDQDVVLNYQLKRPHTGLDLVTSRTAGEDGYFYLTLTAGEDLAKAASPAADYVFVMDVSGSMGADGKLLAAKKAVQAFVQSLDPADRFELLSFSEMPSPLFSKLAAADDAAKEQARAFISSRGSAGGTVLKPAMSLAYRYVDTDRPLNVIILSDGMTETGERQELLALIKARPTNARVFCIGVGNEVNRPLLEQLAEDSGGLAAFISQGDHFDRQAQAFRRKLQRPAASALKINIQGAEVYDVEPAVLPSLYYGSPLHIYGRYKNAGSATVAISGDVRGFEFKQDAKMDFPKTDAENPEIERMWAAKRIDQLLKQADRGGNRQAVADQVVALGEGYSIVTEYTSFLVLENDAEYQRWSIDRRNRTRTGRDRAAQQRREEMLTALRENAQADLGPQALETAAAPTTAKPSRSTPSTPVVASRDPAPRATPQARSWDISLPSGTGPVTPFFLLAAAALGLRRRKQT